MSGLPRATMGALRDLLVAVLWFAAIVAFANGAIFAALLLAALGFSVWSPRRRKARHAGD